MRLVTRTRTGNRITGLPAVALVFVAVVALGPSPAGAQDTGSAAFSEYLAISQYVPMRPPTSAFTGDDALIHGLTHKLAPRWKASYGLGPVEETDLSAAFLRYDQTLAYGTRSDPALRENWRHFLGLEYSPFRNFSLVGGIAKAGGLSRAGYSPSGYERLRLNTGLRWSMQEWLVDGSCSFIPTGAGRIPGDAGYMPGVGGSNPTYYFSLSVSRQF